MLVTTHYMDEADKLCDRIAIVDHGKLVALDTPAALKASIPGRQPRRTLDDVFVHYTGRALRDALQEPSAADSRSCFGGRTTETGSTCTEKTCTEPWPSSSARCGGSAGARC